MNCYDEIFNTIKELIENKEISSYQINKDTGTNMMVILMLCAVEKEE